MSGTFISRCMWARNISMHRAVRQTRIRTNQPSEMKADEILPIAREAHERVQFKNVHPQQEEDRVVAAGEAVETPQLDQLTYRTCATNVVRDELHKAGWRLADLLEKVL